MCWKHKKDLKKKKENKKKPFDGKYFNCGKMGHQLSACKKKKKENEKGKTAIDEEHEPVLFTIIDDDVKPVQEEKTKFHR